MQEADGRRKRRAPRRFGQARNPLRPADSNLLVEDQSGKLTYPMQLTSPTGQHHAAARDFVKAAGLETIAHQLKGLFDARRNDPDKQRFRHVIDMTLILFADLWDSDRLALVGTRGNGAAEERLHAFGVGHRGREPAGNIVCYVAAADGHIVGMDQIAVEKHPDRRRSAAHVNDGHTECDFVLDEAGEPRRIRAYDEGIDVEMRAPDRRAVIAHTGHARGHHVHVDAESVAKHPARVADAATIVDREPDGHRMDDVLITRLAYQVTLLKHPLHFRICDLPPGNADLGLDNARGEEPARQIRHNLLDRLARHFLSGVHR